METVLSALSIKLSDMEDVAYRAWARFLDRVEVFKNFTARAKASSFCQTEKTIG